MSFFRKLLGKKTSKSTSNPTTVPPASPDPADDPDMIRTYDEYGREMFISKQQWRDNVLLGNLENNRNNPDELYSMIVGALEDGFAADVVGHAERLKNIDPIPTRGATILGIVYMEVGRLDDAQRVFEEFTARRGEEGVVFTNLAKVYSHRGDDTRAESTLWHALELDPNQDNGFEWYVAMQRDRRGEAAALDAFRRIAALPNSWRARLWLARDAIQRKDSTTAIKLYEEALALAEQPVPADLLMQMSGDLGNGGYLDEIVRLVEPCFDPAFHGVQVGNNLIKANLELKRKEQARQVLNLLYAQNRPDWTDTLRYWDTELAGADTAERAQTPPGKPSLSLLSIEGPLWMRDGSPFAALLPAKPADAPRIAVFGSSALLEQSPDRPALQLTDGPGRLSRAAPLILAEAIHLATDAVGLALIPWAQGRGFALFGSACEDEALCDLTRNDEHVPDFMVGVTIDATQPVWQIVLRLVRPLDGARMAETSVKAIAENPGPATERLAEALKRLLAIHAGVRMTPAPAWYCPPSGQDASEYLLRLEQQLAVACEHLDFLEGGGLYGEREMLDGTLQFCVNQPKNPTVRMLFAQMLRLMKKVRPELVPEYKKKTDHLQRDFPITGEIEPLVGKALMESFAG